MVASGKNMRGKYPRSPRLASKFAHQFFTRAMTAATRIALVRDHHRAHELLNALCDFSRALCLYNVHATHEGSPFLAPANAWLGPGLIDQTAASPRCCPSP